MVGGTIQDVYMFEDRLSLLVRGTGCESSDLRCIDVTLDAAREGVSRGDTIWWQANIALWTPHQGPPPTPSCCAASRNKSARRRIHAFPKCSKFGMRVYQSIK